MGALQNQGFKPYLAYNVALCYYRLKEYGPSLKYCGKIFDTCSKFAWSRIRPMQNAPWGIFFMLQLNYTKHSSEWI